MAGPATTPEQYLAALPAERRELFERIRQTILDNLPPGFEETVAFGMLGYVVPLADFPDTYNGQALQSVALANQKQYVSLYLMGVYGDPAEHDWFVGAWKDTDRKLDMGKSCVRFRKVEDVAFDVLAEAVARVTPQQLIAVHEAAHRPA